MSILIDRNTKVLVLGITGKSGKLQTEIMKKYGTNIVAGVTPGKGGLEVEEISVYNFVQEATDQHNIDAAIIDINLPGGVEELLEACLSKSRPIIAMGAPPLKETEHLVEIMYYEIPYVKKFGNEGDARPDRIIARVMCH